VLQVLQVLQALQVLGIGAGPATVYLALVTEPDANLADLAARSGLEEGEVDEAVAQLARLGLIEAAHPGLAAETVVQLADPDFALTASLRRREADLARQQHELAQARATIAAATAAYQASAGYPARCARPLASQQEAIGVAWQIMNAELDECLIALPDLTGTLGHASEQLADAASRGARVAIICADAARSSPARVILDRLERAGVQVRTLPAIAVPLIVGSPPLAAVIWAGVSETSAPAVLARDPVFARAIAGIFENYWDTAIPLQKAIPPDPLSGLTPADQALLAMLASGLGGEAAARRLGTSLTTVRRQIAGLKETLQADSLFQAGYLAAKRGWI
jgi:sugar-specific transcriptional regulator TrmB/DNA-binding CsgD family transcriptional regulator